MPYVALSRTSTLNPIVGFLGGRGVSVDRLLARIDLPAWVTSDPEALIPATSGIHLLGAALREADVPNLGLTMGERTSLDRYGVFGHLVRSAPTVGAALAAAVRYGDMLSSIGTMWLRPRDDRVELCRADHADLDPGDPGWQQMTHLTLGVMLSVVRLGAGSDWRPLEVHLQTDEVKSLRDADALSGARIEFRQPATMVAVPRALLEAPIPPPPSVEVPANLVDDWISSAPAHDFVGSIRQAIETLSSGDEYPSVAETATFLGMSTRTLQRRLAASGASHERLVAACRFETAAAVLEQHSAKILELALDLGYSDHANFTRAFRRWAGCSPREYRARCAQRRSLGSRAA